MVLTHVAAFVLFGLGAPLFELITRTPGLAFAGFVVLVAGPGIPALTFRSRVWAGVTLGYVLLPLTPVFWMFTWIAVKTMDRLG